MKLSNLLIASICLSSWTLLAQGSPNGAAPTTSAPPSVDTGSSPASSASTDPVSKLSQADKERLRDLLNDIMTAYGHEKFDVALSKLDAADAICPQYPVTINIRGGIFMRQKKWDQAAAQFNRALAIDPKTFEAKFNLAEIPYQQKKYTEARAGFQKILLDKPNNQLLQYKIYLSYLMEGNLAQAQTWLNKFDPYDDTPAYYFGQAAWLYNKNQNDQATSYINSAIKIYPAQLNNIFGESLIEAGWLKRQNPD